MNIRTARAAFYVLFFACAGTLLGLTAYHVHFTETLGVGNIYVPVVVELLVTSALAVLVSIWVFTAIMRHFHNDIGRGVEIVLLFIIWVMFLVGASVFSRRWPNFLWCIGSSSVCQLLDAVIAFSWINFVFSLTLFILCAVDNETEQTGVHGA